MFLQLSHTKLDVYISSRAVVLNSYTVTKNFPTYEKFGLVSQIRRAALSIHLNLAEGCAMKTKASRKRYYEISRASLIELDTAIGVSNDLGYVKMEEISSLGENIILTFKLLTGMINKT